MSVVRVACLQLNTVVGDLRGNVEKIAAAVKTAEAAGCDLAVAPELALCGYPPEDLVLKAGFVADVASALGKLAVLCKSIRCAVVVGFVEGAVDSDGLSVVYNSAALLQGGVITGVYRKQLLPNNSVFDEKRYFEPGDGSQKPFNVAGLDIGVLICEDLWSSNGPCARSAGAGAKVIIGLNSSPFFGGRIGERIDMLGQRARETGLPVVYVNHVGGQDELVFDGGSMVLDAQGSVVARSAQFSEEVLVAEIDADTGLVASDRNEGDLGAVEEIYRALVCGTRDYVTKNGFSDVVIGLSGGIDSTLVAAVASDALGTGRVHGVAMPSRYSSEGSVSDAAELSRRLGIELRIIPIEAAHRAFTSMLSEAEFFGGVHGDNAEPAEPVGLADENLQSRIRGVTMMVLSNQYGWMVLTTGNKSELAVGYSTLYGDTAGGFAVIKDVPKTLVYELCRYRNSVGDAEVIPQSVLDKAPSAELRPDQRDDQSLPAYEILDALVEGYVESDATVAELVELGFDPGLARRVARLVDLAEYKRRQSPPGVRVSRKAFGKDRRMPITNAYGVEMQEAGLNQSESQERGEK